MCVCIYIYMYTYEECTRLKKHISSNFNLPLELVSSHDFISAGADLGPAVVPLGLLRSLPRGRHRRRRRRHLSLRALRGLRGGATHVERHTAGAGGCLG